MTTVAVSRSTHMNTARAAIVAAAPVVLAAALLWHPYIPGRLPNEDAIADAVVAVGTTRWGLAHLAATLASGVLLLAFIVIRGFLREAGDASRSAIGLAFIVLGSTAYAMLPGMEFAVLAAVDSGADAVAIQAALDEWFPAVLLIGAVLFAIGVALVGTAVVRYAALGRMTAWIILGALVVMAAARTAPFAAAQFYVQSSAALVALWPLAWAIRRTGGTLPKR